MNLDQFFTKNSLKTYQKWLTSQKLPAATIKRKLSSLNKFKIFYDASYLKKEANKIYISRSKSITIPGSELPKKFGTFLVLALLLAFSAALGIYGYQQIFKEVVQQYAYPQAPSPTIPNRYLSFQARLTDSSDNPITVPTDFRFIVYDNVTASGSAKLWEEQRYIDPDRKSVV